MLATVEKFSETVPRCAVCETTEDLVEGIYDGEEKAVCSCCESSYYAYCNICESWNYAENQEPCRHLFWDDAVGDWSGCGSDRQDYKENVWALLELLDRAVVVRLKDSLRRHRYYLQFCGSIFGVEEIRTELYDGHRVTWVPEAFRRVFEADLDSTASARNGVNWLMSLWAGYEDNWEPETPEADELTAGWIEEWLMQSTIEGEAE
jgi:hypothetical protein